MIRIKTCQSQTYWREVSCLQSKSAGSKQLPLIRQLRLFLDDAGFIRCRGRIHNAPLSQLAKFPYLLPPRHPLTALIVYSVHTKLFHARVNSCETSLLDPNRKAIHKGTVASLCNLQETHWETIQSTRYGTTTQSKTAGHTTRYSNRHRFYGGIVHKTR